MGKRGFLSSILILGCSLQSSSGRFNANEDIGEGVQMIKYLENASIFGVGAGTNNNGVPKHGEFVDSLVCNVPTQIQYNHLKNEYYNFVHFGLNTFAGREWGPYDEHGNGLYTITDKNSKYYVEFNPVNIDTDQWVQSFVASGTSGIIFTAKHHDGFCLWDTKTTSFSVAHTNWGKERISQGKSADIVGMLAESCRKFGVALGIYVSPWDMHLESNYGKMSYLPYYYQQLEELTTKYGELFCVWFDGAEGEMSKDSWDKDFRIDYEVVNSIIKRNQKNCISALGGGELRWIGNEAGIARKQEWSVIPTGEYNVEKMQELSQKSLKDAKRLQKIGNSNEILGSRERMLLHDKYQFLQAEADTSIMKSGWFSHKRDRAKSFKRIVNTYYKTVGHNAHFLLNVGVNTDGLIPKKAVEILKRLGQYTSSRLSARIDYTSSIGGYNDGKVTLKKCQALTSALKGEFSTYNDLFDYSKGVFDSSDNSSYMLADDEHIIDLDFQSASQFSTIVLREDLRYSQRVESFDIYAKNEDGTFTLISSQAIIGNNRTILFKKPIKALGVRIIIKQSRSNAVLDYVGIYK